MSKVPTLKLDAEALVRIGANPSSKENAIREAGQLLVASGCVSNSFVDSMLKRESAANTYLGSGVAIPHCLLEDKSLIHQDGIAVLQVPNGIEWNPGQIARFVVGIAAKSDTHITVLRRLTRLMQDEELLERLCSTATAAEIVAALSDDKSAQGAPASGAPAALPEGAESITWTVDYPSGVHARPASKWVTAAKSASTPIRLLIGDKIVDPRNLVSLLQLGLSCGDTVVIFAEGSEAKTTLDRFYRIITEISEQEKSDAEKAKAKEPKKSVQGWNPPSGRAGIQGVAASPGLAIGTIVSLEASEIVVEDKPTTLEEGGNLLNSVLDKARHQMKAIIDDTTRRLGDGDAEIFRAQASLLDDTDLITSVCQNMAAGHGVAFAWNKAIEKMASGLAAQKNEILAARAADLRDIGNRVLALIDPTLEKKGLSSLPDEPCIITASDLSPSDTAGLDPEKVAGLATSLGGPTSHTAILARTLGIPAVVAGGPDVLKGKEGSTAIVDGDSGSIWFDPTDEEVKSARDWILSLEKKRAEEEAERSLPATTTDGYTAEISANVNTPDQVALALSQGAEGVGLMRTEFLFLESGETPNEEQQFTTYKGMADALGGKPLIIRALDIGGDKQVAHLQLPKEENPFLGVRGVRLLLRRPDLFVPQMRALYSAAKAGSKLSVMFPMITSLTEVLELKKRCEEIRTSLKAPEIPLGIMIEVPAAALLADVLAEHVAFFSIGTNDLTQYTLAIDRQNPDLAPEADGLHPAVLRLIHATVQGATKHGRWVGVCGGLAGDPFGAALLTGLGVTELSMTPRDIPAVKALLRKGSKAQFSEVAQKALSLSGPKQVRELAAEFIKSV